MQIYFDKKFQFEILQVQSTTLNRITEILFSIYIRPIVESIELTKK